MTTGRARQRKGPYHQVYMSHVEHAISACRTVSPLQHAGEKGRIREILLRSLFRPLLPSDLGIGTGFIVGAAGAVSTQQDIILYDRSTLPPALFDSDLGFFPIESVLHTIEVKSTLTRHELSTSHQAAKSLASFMIHDSNGNMISGGSRPCSTIFALDSDLSTDGKSETSRYDEIRGKEAPHLSAICVVGRGYWRFENGAFRAWPERYELSEVIGFIGGILNDLPKLYEVRRAARPPLGSYLIDFGADFTSVLLAIARIGAEFESLAKMGELTFDVVKELLVRFDELSHELNEIFSEYEEANPHDGYEKIREFVEGLATELRATEVRLTMRTTTE